MRWWPLLVVFACDAAPEPAAPPARVEGTLDAPAPARPAVSVPAPPVRSPLEVAASGLDTLPEVAAWLPEADRCGRQGRRRFCNGPRRVPKPEGPAAALAERLGLGTHRAAAELIRGAPRSEWLAALEPLRLVPATALRWPVDGGRFGRGVTFAGRRLGGHRGVDITAKVGTPVRAVADALVGYADNTVRGYGNLLVLLHGGGEVSAYAHLSAVHVFPGQIVRRGQVVARAGNTGISRGPHLHFEWREGGRLADPMGRFPTAHVPRWMRPHLAAR